MCATCMSQFTGPFKSNTVFTNGLVSSKRYSNMTTSEASDACQAEGDADPTAFGVKYGTDFGSFDKCIKQKKNQATGQQVVTTVTNAGNFFTQIGSVLQAFMGSQQGALPGGNPPPPADQPKGISAGAWIAIVLGIVTVIGVAIVVVKAKNKGDK